MASSNEAAENAYINTIGLMRICLSASWLFHMIAFLPFFYGCEFFKMMEYFIGELK